MIGFLGAITFMSFSIGSLAFADLTDNYGRKQVVLFSGAVTPIGLISLLFVHNIQIIYVIIFLIGLTYSPRSNIAYLYGSEFLEEKFKL